MKTPVQVTILGQSFTLRGDAPPEKIQRVADYVNRTVAEVAASGKVVDSLNVSLLALMNVAQAYLQLCDQREAEQGDAARIERLTRRIDKALSRRQEETGTMSLYGDLK